MTQKNINGREPLIYPDLEISEPNSQDIGEHRCLERAARQRGGVDLRGAQ